MNGTKIYAGVFVEVTSSYINNDTVLGIVLDNKGVETDKFKRVCDEFIKIDLSFQPNQIDQYPVFVFEENLVCRPKIIRVLPASLQEIDTLCEAYSLFHRTVSLGPKHRMVKNCLLSLKRYLHSEYSPDDNTPNHRMFFHTCIMQKNNA